MKVLVDTCIWSQVLRHRYPDKNLIKIMRDLINDSRVITIGPIRQELLSGISDVSKFESLKDKLSAFPDIELAQKYFIKAAEFSNVCRKRGIQGSNTDFLICAVASLSNCYIYTSDNDFNLYKKYLPIMLLREL